MGIKKCIAVAVLALATQVEACTASTTNNYTGKVILLPPEPCTLGFYAFNEYIFTNVQGGTTYNGETIIIVHRCFSSQSVCDGQRNMVGTGISIGGPTGTTGQGGAQRIATGCYQESK